NLLTQKELRAKIKLSGYVTDKIGLPTLTDIMNELEKPGRDPREEFKPFTFAEGIEKMEDLKVGLKIPGIVTNVTAFGAFVDIGVHQDGLVHISELADNFVKDASSVVKVQQKVEVTVLEIDIPRKRLALSMKTNPGDGGRHNSASAPNLSNQPKSQSGKKNNQKSAEPQMAKPFNNPFAALKKG
ncbi:MAG: S1 RNA-binding domain-containing protein, partial [Candidatus Adiutrix sp.]